MADLTIESKPMILPTSAAKNNSLESVVIVPSTRRILDLEQDGNNQIDLNLNQTTKTNNTKIKPELTFSIERILGLKPRSTKLSNSFHNNNSPIRPPPVIGNYYVTPSDQSRVVPKEEVDDGDDEDDDDDCDNDSIDVEDQTAIEESERDIFMTAYSNFGMEGEMPQYQWLQCTRYHPPKIQRSKKKEGTKRRKLGRNPRVPFTQHQVSVLEDKFRRTHYLSSMDVAELSTALNLTETRVKIWFQNRRARERRDKEASQRNQVTMVTKANSFQPLTIPSVAWPINASLTPPSYAQFPAAIDYRQGYLASGFNFFNSVRDTHVRDAHETVMRNHSHPAYQEK